MSASRIDELYGLPPDEFTAARNELAKALKREGKADEAARVAKLRKPSAVVAAVNRAARADREAVDAFIEADEVLRKAQSGAGRVDALRTAMQEHRDALKRLAGLAEEQLGKATLAQGRAIQATIQGAAAGGKELRDKLRRGVIEEELEAPGFDVFGLAAATAPVRDEPRAPAKAAPPEKPPKPAKRGGGKAHAAAEREAAKAAAAAAREEARRAAAEQREREREKKRLAKQAASLEAAAAKAEQRAAQAREALEAAQAKVEEAERDAKEARKAADEASDAKQR